jgi:hypothetical protein
MAALAALQTVDFSRMAYRGYLVRRNALTGDMWIEKDGQMIHRVPSTQSWNYARQTIDALID